MKFTDEAFMNLTKPSTKRSQDHIFHISKSKTLCAITELIPRNMRENTPFSEEIDDYRISLAGGTLDSLSRFLAGHALSYQRNLPRKQFVSSVEDGVCQLASTYAIAVAKKGELQEVGLHAILTPYSDGVRTREVRDDNSIQVYTSYDKLPIETVISIPELDLQSNQLDVLFREGEQFYEQCIVTGEHVRLFEMDKETIAKVYAASREAELAVKYALQNYCS